MNPVDSFLAGYLPGLVAAHFFRHELLASALAHERGAAADWLRHQADTHPRRGPEIVSVVMELEHILAVAGIPLVAPPRSTLEGAAWLQRHYDVTHERIVMAPDAAVDRTAAFLMGRSLGNLAEILVQRTVLDQLAPLCEALDWWMANDRELDGRQHFEQQALRMIVPATHIDVIPTAVQRLYAEGEPLAAARADARQRSTALSGVRRVARSIQDALAGPLLLPVASIDRALTDWEHLDRTLLRRYAGYHTVALKGEPVAIRIAHFGDHWAAAFTSERALDAFFALLPPPPGGGVTTVSGEVLFPLLGRMETKGLVFNPFGPTRPRWVNWRLIEQVLATAKAA